VFSIDGLEDTNHIYRRHTKWQNIINNAKAFIDAGGAANWNFIAFRHNEHQITEAARLAKELGFKRFYVKKTGRFFRDGHVEQSFPILDSSGIVVGRLELPISTELRNTAAEAIQTQGGEVSDYHQALEESEIECVAAASRGIYISAEGLVLPCCWMGQLYNYREPDTTSQIRALVQSHSGGMDSINATVHPLESIIQGPLFQAAIPAGWERGPDRLKVCSIHCGHVRLRGAQMGKSLL
jgi:MoaA/NifB/PqqE/SkfB family radical SAM enzyme